MRKPAECTLMRVGSNRGDQFGGEDGDQNSLDNIMVLVRTVIEAL